MIDGVAKILGHGYELRATWPGGFEPANPAGKFEVVEGGVQGASVASRIRAEMERNLDLYTVLGPDSLPAANWYAFVVGIQSIRAAREEMFELEVVSEPDGMPEIDEAPEGAVY